MSHQGGQESHPGYMDGVCVKISENYKPPPRINNVVNYSWLKQQLQQQAPLREKQSTYDFSLENNIKSVMQDVRSIRKTTLDTKRDKLEKIKAARRIESEKASSNVETEPVVCTCAASKLVTTPDVYPSYSRILTPMPLIANNTPNTASATDKSPFNIADFEADTSSPFDNMELKTINDIEELAQVLNKDEMYNKNYSGTTPLTNYIPNTVYNPQGPTLVTTTASYNNLNRFYYSPNQNYYSGFNNSIEPVKSGKVEISPISSINKALKDTCISNETVSSNEKTKNEADETFELLPKNLQRLSQNVSSMGFPLPRVARVCQALGDDQKRVVEHLLIMSELLDLGFSEKDVSCALIQSNNDRDRALDILIT